MEQAKTYLLRNILPAFAVMFFGFVGSYFVYQTYYTGKTSTASAYASISPAAGDTVIKEGGRTYIEIDIDNIPHYSANGQ